MISSALLSLAIMLGDSELQVSAEDLSAIGCTFRVARSDSLLLRDGEYLLRGIHRGLKSTAHAETTAQITIEEHTSWLVRCRAEWPPRSDFSAMIRRCMAELTDYTILKNAGDDGALSRALTGYPAEAETDFPADFFSWRRDLLSQAQVDEHWAEVLNSAASLAAAATGPKSASAFLSQSLESYWHGGLRQAGLAEHPLQHRLPDSILLGHMTCPSLLPDPTVYARLLESCMSRSLSPLLALPPMPQDRVKQYRDLLYITAAQAPDAEIIVNDFGPALMARTENLRLSFAAGPLLARRRKDPRIRWWLGDVSLLEETSSDSDSFKQLLRRCGIGTAVRECCGYPIRTAPGDWLLLPFYLTNTASSCTLRAACRTSRRGDQAENDHCNHECLTHCFLYGTPLQMIGRSNSLYGADLRCLTDGEYLSGILQGGAKRIIVDLL